MDSRTTFRFEAGEIRFEITGSEDFVRRNLPAFLPFVSRVAGVPGAAAKAQQPVASSAGAPSSGATGATAVSAAPAGPAAAASPPEDLRTWYDRLVPAASRISMQDQILVFAFWMRGFKKYIFTSEDIRRGFETIGQTEPKSLLQILGTLKRDHALILGTERRGEYMLNTTGIERVRQVLGIPAPGKPAGAPRETQSPREMTDAERAARAVMNI